MTAAQFRQALLPHLAEADLDLQPVGDLPALWRIQLGETARQELGEDVAEIAIDLGPRLVQGFLLVLVERDDRFLDLPLIPDHGLHHVLQRGFLLLHAVNHVHDLGVDLLLHALEALRQVPEGGSALGDVLAFEVVRAVRTAETLFFVRDPVVLLLHLFEHLSGALLIFVKLLDLVGKFLHLEAFFRNT